MTNNTQLNQRGISSRTNAAGGMQNNSRQTGGRADNAQDIPLTQGQEQTAQHLEEQIQSFEQKMHGMSNDQLKQMSQKLDLAERSALVNKIDHQLHTIKETIVKPGDAASQQAAAASSTAVIQNASDTTTP